MAMPNPGDEIGISLWMQKFSPGPLAPLIEIIPEPDCVCGYIARLWTHNGLISPDAYTVWLALEAEATKRDLAQGRDHDHT